MIEEVGTSEEKNRNVEYTAFGRQILTQVTKLQRGALANESWAAAALAKLRRGIGKEPGEVISLLEWTSPGIFVAEDQSDEITREEHAAYLALTLYAVHQQGHSAQGMHRSTGESIGSSARKLRLALGEHGADGVVRRFNAIGTATSSREIVRHAQGLVNQMRGEAIAIDYATFAQDLVKMMQPAHAAAVRNRWGRHFHRYEPTNPKS